MALTLLMPVLSGGNSAEAIVHEITGAACNNPTGRAPEPKGQFDQGAPALMHTVVESVDVDGSGNVTINFDVDHPAWKGDPNAPDVTFPNGDGTTTTLHPGFACP